MWGHDRGRPVAHGVADLSLSYSPSSIRQQRTNKVLNSAGIGLRQTTGWIRQPGGTWNTVVCLWPGSCDRYHEYKRKESSLLPTGTNRSEWMLGVLIRANLGTCMGSFPIIHCFTGINDQKTFAWQPCLPWYIQSAGYPNYGFHR